MHLARYYYNADVYVQPFFTEAFALPVLEAMASGVSVVATRVGGIPEAAVNGKTGLLVESSNAIALTEAILHLLLNKEKIGKKK